MRRNEFKIKDKSVIEDILNSSEYCTFAFCKDNTPYSLLVNFVYKEDIVYFHGAKKGKKIEFIEANSKASFSIAQPYSLIQSYFSSTDEMACPATQFFRSVCADGVVTIIEDYDEKVKALSLIMQKLQPEGRYIPLDDEIYTKMVNSTEVFRFDIKEIFGKIKLGQHLPKERFDMILSHIENRGSQIDKLTSKLMREISD